MPPLHGAKRKGCSHERCTNQVVNDGVAQRLSVVNSRVVPTMSLKKEFVSRTAQRGKNAALRDVPIKKNGGVCYTDIARIVSMQTTT